MLNDSCPKFSNFILLANSSRKQAIPGNRQGGIEKSLMQNKHNVWQNGRPTIFNEAKYVHVLAN